MFFTKKKQEVKVNIQKGARFILVDTEGKGCCPFYYKYLAQGRIVPRRSVQSITCVEGGIYFITTKEENHRISMRDVVFQMHMIRDYCLSEEIDCAYMPMQMWSKDRHNAFWLNTVIRKIFKNTSTKLVV